MKKLCLIVIVAIFCTGCPMHMKYHDVYSTHFVLKYYNVNSIKLRISPRFEHTAIAIKAIPFYEVDKYEYDNLCVKHNDIGYNTIAPDVESRYYINIDFITMSIVSDADFDDEHLAGVELGNIVMFRSQSPILYIRNGYTGYDTGHGLTPNYPIDKLVCDLLIDDLILLGPSTNFAYLEFILPPTISKTHNITVTMTADDGRVFSDTMQVNWE